jgi:hypothetical protein
MALCTRWPRLLSFNSLIQKEQWIDSDFSEEEGKVKKDEDAGADDSEDEGIGADDSEDGGVGVDDSEDGGVGVDEDVRQLSFGF